ncbi:hypothetical protein DPMN_052587 [Dreissena polymorpha]|uniref:DZANK-type domain-containing protein n=1 Tax=Dreissena polymorpha TaxID=45954 RepID=A0A9D4HRE9_DREPO|nr:hypothetical protein DPMN_052587 [Dreissena polymorpha]
MKCPKCGIEGDRKFCQECGTKLAVKAKVILCTGKNDEGYPCNAEISSDQNFCKRYGHLVNQAWFWSGKCGKCGATCPEEQNLCATCVMAQTSGNDYFQLAVIDISSYISNIL